MDCAAAAEQHGPASLITNHNTRKNGTPDEPTLARVRSQIGHAVAVHTVLAVAFLILMGFLIPRLLTPLADMLPGRGHPRPLCRLTASIAYFVEDNLLLVSLVSGVLLAGNGVLLYALERRFGTFISSAWSFAVTVTIVTAMLVALYAISTFFAAWH